MISEITEKLDFAWFFIFLAVQNMVHLSNPDQKNTRQIFLPGARSVSQIQRMNARDSFSHALLTLL